MANKLLHRSGDIEMANITNELHIKEEIDISNDDYHVSHPINCQNVEVKIEAPDDNEDPELEVMRIESPKMSCREMRLQARKALEPYQKKRTRKAKAKPKPKAKAPPKESSEDVSVEEIIGCRNRNQFCYICGLFTPPNNTRNLTPSLVASYEEYFAVSFVPNPGYVPDVACEYCYRGLMGWKNKSERHKIKYVEPVKWIPQTEHLVEKCYFCLTKVTGFRYNTREKVTYAEVDSVIKALVRSEDNSTAPTEQSSNRGTASKDSEGRHRAPNASDKSEDGAQTSLDKQSTSPSKSVNPSTQEIP
ncbi:uncharacterized protein LOC142232851 [Haematobia irritans]|uniref:uncharacterized protein LOC142232851 n=1 Tax=Haematobia irritans TaxID=7368 RepID=UPI003F4FA1AF